MSGFDEASTLRLRIRLLEDLLGLDNVDVAEHAGHRSVSFLRQHWSSSRSAAMLYEAALNRDIGQREMAIGREDSALRHFAAGLLLQVNDSVFLFEDMMPFGDISERYCLDHNTDACMVAAYFMFITRSEHARALDYLRKLGSSHPTIPMLRAALHVARGEFRAAIEEYTLALQLGDAAENPFMNEAYFLRGLARFETADFAGLCEDFQKYISHCVGDEQHVCEVYFHYAYMDWLGSFKVEARKWYDQGIEAEGKRSPVFSHHPNSVLKSMLIAKFDKPMHACARIGCHEEGKLKCSRCLLVRYCGAACQSSDWRAGHKAACVRGSPTGCEAAGKQSE